MTPNVLTETRCHKTVQTETVRNTIGRQISEHFQRFSNSRETNYAYLASSMVLPSELVNWLV